MQQQQEPSVFLHRKWRRNPAPLPGRTRLMLFLCVLGLKLYKYRLWFEGFLNPKLSLNQKNLKRDSQLFLSLAHIQGTPEAHNNRAHGFSE